VIVGELFHQNLRAYLVFWVAWAAAVNPRVALAQDAAAKEPVTWREMIDRAADNIQIYPEANWENPAKPEVALRWGNPARGRGEEGATVLYVHAGRPLAAACFYPWQGRLIYDMEAISRDAIVGRRDGAVAWRPAARGVAFAEIPDASSPGASRAQRLRQMKDLAEEFQSTMMGWKEDDSDREELRLLPRPLFRYGPAEGEIVDGAVFAFVMGTDPESLLLLEAVKDGAGARWEYSFARRTSGQLEGRYRGKVVWTAAKYPETRDPRQPHFSLDAPIPPHLLSDGAGKVETAQ
jgi:hypothetical protein